MTKLESVQDIKDAAIELLKTIIRPDVADAEIGTAEEALRQLVDQFYRENADMMAPEQYKAARNDLEYFARLVNLAVAYYQEDEVKKGEP